MLQAGIRDLVAMSEMDVMQILTKSSNGSNGTVSDSSALVKHQISQPWGSLDNLLNPNVLNLNAVCKIEYTEALKGGTGGEVQEGAVGDADAICKTKFSQAGAFTDESGDGVIFESMTILEIDFKQLSAVSGECNNGLVDQLGASVAFELSLSA
jgi:hypothetical protein